MNVKFTTTTRAKLPTLAITNGQIIALSDAVGYYYDMGNVRYPASSISVVSELPEYGALNMMYVVSNGTSTEASMYLWDDTKYVRISGSDVVIDDGNASTATVYSSAKTESLVSGIIDDSAASTTTAYSSQKTDDQIKGLIDDTTASTESVYSSSKVTELVEASVGAIIDDTAASTATVYSSSKTDAQIASLINDTTASTASAYSSSKVDQLIRGITSLTIEIVQVLPTEDIDDHKIYFLERTVPGEGNVYDEYMYISNAWELIGTTEIEISLATTATAGIVKPDGTTITVTNDGTISAVGGSSGHTIVDDGGGSVSAEPNLQFKGAYVEDDSTNSNTVVNVVRQMSYASVAQLTDAQKKGIILTERDNNPIVAPFNAQNTSYSNVVSHLSATNVQSAVDELQTYISSLMSTISQLRQELDDMNTMIASTLSAGATTVSFTDERITSNSIIDPYVWVAEDATVESIAPLSQTCSEGECVLEFDAQDSDIVVGIRVSEAVTPQS